MSTWNLYTLESGDVWTIDTTMPRPNADLETILMSTQQKVKLADGSFGYITPEFKSSREMGSMTFIDTTSAFRTTIEGYINNGDIVKIETHTSDYFCGRFVNMSRVWLAGVDDSYDITVGFERIAYYEDEI